MDDYLGDLLFFVMLLSVGFILGVLAGAKLTRGDSEKQAIEHNAAYYNPTNKVFTWK